MSRLPRVIGVLIVLLAAGLGCGGDNPPTGQTPPPGAGAGGTGGSQPAGGGAGGSATGPGGSATGGTGGSGSPPSPSPSPPRDGSAAASPDAGPPGDAPGSVIPPGTDPAPGEYGTRAPLLERNSEMAVAALDGKIYVLGGYPSSPAETRPTLQIYDPAANRWTLGAPSPLPLHHPMIAGVNGKLYSLGGQPNTDVVLEYDPALDTWNSSRQRMPTARGGGAAAVIGSKIYVVGARPPGLTPEAENAFEAYDVAANTWQTLPKLPTAQFNQRNHLAAAAIGGRIYVAGGRYNGGGVNSPMTASLDMFDPATSTWTSKANMLKPRGGVAGTAANGCFHVLGGEGAGVFPDHDVYNPITDTWTALKPLPVPFHGVTGSAFIDGILYLPGGGTAQGGSSGTTMHQVFRPAMRCE